MKTFTLHLIRHGLTQGNIDGIFLGGGMDVPLCEQGVQQLKEMATTHSYPDVGIVFTSPMKRATETVEVLYPLMENVQVVEKMREHQFGEFEGRRYDDMADDPRMAEWLNPESDFTPQGGESGQVFARRIDEGFYDMFRIMMDQDITQAACVTHGGVIMSLMTRWALPKKSPVEWMSDNGSGFTVLTSAAMLMRDRMVEAIDIVPHGYRHENDWQHRFQVE